MARKKPPTDKGKRQLPRRVPPITTSRAFGQKSPLIDADIQAFLARCMSTQNWDTYSDLEKFKITKSFPVFKKVHTTPPPSHATRESLNENLVVSTSRLEPVNQQYESPENPRNLSCPQIPSSQFATDHYIKRAAARFSRDLQEGYYEKAWQDKARRAHEERLDGKLDYYVKQNAEEMFEDGTGSDCAESGDDKDELALESEDGEYSNKVPRKGKTGV